MPKIPGIPNPSGISVSGNINVGVPRVTAEDFGGGKARDTQNFGREFQRAGGTVMDLGIRRERRKADDIYLASHKKIEDVKTELSRRTGRDAENTLAELDKRTQEIVNEASAGLNSRWARERFEEQFGKQNYMNRKWAENHAYAQGQAADMNTFNGLRDKRLQDVEATPGALDNAMRESEAAIREMYAGQDEEFLTAKIGVENAALAERGVMSLGQSSPGEALKMLADPGVEAALGKIKVGKLRGEYENTVVNNDVNVMAMDFAEQTEAGAITSAEVQRLAYEKYPDDPAKPKNAVLRETMLNVYGNHQARLKSDRLNQATRAKQALTEKLAAANFDLEAMSPEEQGSIIADTELFQTVTRFQKWKNGDGEAVSPDYYWIFQQEQRPSKELKEWLNAPSLRPDGGNMDILLRKTGGNKEIINRLFKHALSEEGGADSSEGGGFSGAAKFDPAQFFENGYGSVFVKGILWSAPESYLDDKTNTAKARRNGFLQFYNGALAEKEKELGRKANYEEQQEIAFGLMRSARDGLINLDKSYWMQKSGEESVVEQAASEEPEVDIATIPYEQKRFNRGETVISFSPAQGAPIRNFGRIEPDDARQLSPDIIDYAAKKVLRAYEAGRIADQEYAADDIIAYGRHDEIVIFDGATGKMRGAPLMQVLPSGMAAEAQAQRENAALEDLSIVREAEGELNALRNRKVTLEREYQAMRTKREVAKPDAFSEYVGGKIRGVLHDTFGVGVGEDAKGTPRNNREDMERLQHEKRMREINSEIEKAEQELKRVSGGK